LAATGDQSRPYTFPPRERRGVLLGFTAIQLLTVATGVVVALLVIRTGSSVSGPASSVAVVGVAAALGGWPIAGQPPVAWIPVSARWLCRRARGPYLSPAPLAGHRPGRTAPGLLAPVFTVRHSRGDVQRSVPAIAGVALMAAPERPGDDPMAMVVDHLGGGRSAVLEVPGQSFALLDPEDKRRRLAAWGRVLASAGRAGSPIRRLQWLESAAPGTAAELVDQLEGAAVRDGPAYRSYESLVTAAGLSSRHHRTLLVVTVHPKRAGTRRRRGRAGDDLAELLRREVRLMTGQLATSDLPDARPLDLAEATAFLAAAVATGADILPARSPWAMATEEGWGSYRTDGAAHATYWVAEWPRLDVGPDFLAPLMNCGRRRRVSLVMAPVDPDRAARQVSSARTADMADAELRRRAGFVPNVRRQREAEGVARREAELADGHAEFRFSGYVTVTAEAGEALDSACAEVEQAAQHAHLQLRRLWGRQEEAWSWTLPLGRGLA
jgi:hypothetical protein